MPVSHLRPGYLVSFVLSVLLVGATLRYALRRGLLDAPGRRRSHTVATPRGGGLGLLLAGCRYCLGMSGSSRGLLRSRRWPVRRPPASELVGWLDDHLNLPLLPRFVVHVLAATCWRWLSA